MGITSSRVDPSEQPRSTSSTSSPTPRRLRHIPANSLPSQSRRAETIPPRGPDGKNRPSSDEDLGEDGARVKRRKVVNGAGAQGSSTDIAMSDPSPPSESLPSMFETLPTPIASTSSVDQTSQPIESPPIAPSTPADPLLPGRLDALDTWARVHGQGPDTAANFLDGAAEVSHAQRHHVDPALAAELAARRSRRPPPRATFAQEPVPVGVDSTELADRLDHVAQGRLSNAGNRLLAHVEGRHHFHAANTAPLLGPRAMPPPSIPPVQERPPLVLHSLITVPGSSRPSSVASESESPQEQTIQPCTSMSSLRALKEKLFPSVAKADSAPPSPTSSTIESDENPQLEQATIIADMTSFGALATTAAFIGTQLLASNAISDMPPTRTRLPAATRDIVRRLVDELSQRLRAGIAVPPNIFEEALSQAMADAGGAYVSAAAAQRTRTAHRASLESLDAPHSGRRTSPPASPAATSPGATTAIPSTSSQPDSFDDFLTSVHADIINNVSAFETRLSGSRSASPEPSTTSDTLDIARAYVFSQRAPDALTRDGAEGSTDEAANVLVTVVGLRSITAAQSDSVMEQWRTGTANAVGTEPGAEAVPAPMPDETSAERDSRPSFLRSLSRGWSRSRALQPDALQTQVVSHRTMAEAEAATATTSNNRTYVFWSFSGNFARNHPYLTNLDLLYAQLHRHSVADIVPILGQPKPKVATELDILSSGLKIVLGLEVEQRVESGEIVSNCAERCLICYASYEAEDECRIMRCKHMYHKGCVDTWMRDHHNTCPVCRADGVVASFPGVREAGVEAGQSV